MSLLRFSVGVIVLAACLTAVACKPRPRPVTERQRMEAEHLVAEANFAINIRDWPRAESLLVQATKIIPDAGGYWVSLGSARMRSGNKSGAKAAYESALKAYQREANADSARNDAEPTLKQVPVLALLGRVDDARALLAKTAKGFPDSRPVRLFIEGKHLDKMLADPNFKQGAL